MNSVATSKAYQYDRMFHIVTILLQLTLFGGGLIWATINFEVKPEDVAVEVRRAQHEISVSLESQKVLIQGIAENVKSNTALVSKNLERLAEIDMELASRGKWIEETTQWMVEHSGDRWTKTDHENWVKETMGEKEEPNE